MQILRSVCLNTDSFAVKTWAKHYNLCDARNFFVSSYSLTLMTIVYLQVGRTGGLGWVVRSFVCSRPSVKPSFCGKRARSRSVLEELLFIPSNSRNLFVPFQVQRGASKAGGCVLSARSAREDRVSAPPTLGERCVGGDRLSCNRKLSFFVFVFLAWHPVSQRTPCPLLAVAAVLSVRIFPFFMTKPPFAIPQCPRAT